MPEDVFQESSYENWWLGRTVLVTGATSGIGRALAQLLGREGAKVIAHGRSKERMAEVVKKGRLRITSVFGDLKSRKGQEALQTAIIEKQPEALVLNAGYNVRKEYASGWSDEEIHEMLEVNLTSSILCARTFASLPKTDTKRRLALILSTSCHFPREQMSLYVACKSGMMGFGKALHQEALTLGIRTTLFYPGRANTSFRAQPNESLMRPESVARAIASVLSLPEDLVPNEFTFRPEIDTNI